MNAQVDTLLEARGVSKHYGAVKALDGIDFSIRPGELVAIVGDNGAGKSTFIKSLSGVSEISSGSMRFLGREVELNSPNDARSLGIETVYQDLGLCENLTVSENVYLGREPTKGWGPFRYVDRSRMHAELSEVLRTISINVPATDAKVGELSGGQRQAVAISRCKLWKSSMVILDEPTAALGVQESRRVVETIQRLHADGVAVIVISHDIPMVKELAERIVVLRKGRKVADTPAADVTEHEIVALITGAGAQHGTAAGLSSEREVDR